MLESTGIFLPIAGLVILAIVLVAAVVSRYKVAKPNEALVINGRKSREGGVKVVVDGGTFVWPVIEQLTRLDISSKTIPVEVQGAPSSQGIPLNVTAVAAVKIGSDAQSVRAAAQRFANQQELLSRYINDQLSGALRAIVGNMTVEDIMRNREAFKNDVVANVTDTLAAQGLVLDTITIQDVRDHGEGTYIRDMGRPSAALIQQQALIAEADADRESTKKRVEAETQKANYQRELALRQAAILSETQRAEATSKAAGPLEKAARDQEILTAQEIVAARQAELTERELDTTVRRPADAENYRIGKLAEAQKNAAILAAQAAAEEARLQGEGDLALRRAQAEATQVEGTAQAEAIRAKGLAEAEAIDKRAEAYEKFNDAAKLDRLLEVLPDIAKELASPMGNIKELNVVSTDGASALPKAVTNNFAQLNGLLKGYGIDLDEWMKGKTNPTGTEQN